MIDGARFKIACVLACASAALTTIVIACGGSAEATHQASSSGGASSGCPVDPREGQSCSVPNQRCGDCRPGDDFNDAVGYQCLDGSWRPYMFSCHASSPTTCDAGPVTCPATATEGAMICDCQEFSCVFGDCNGARTAGTCRSRQWSVVPYPCDAGSDATDASDAMDAGASDG